MRVGDEEEGWGVKRGDDEFGMTLMKLLSFSIFI